MKKLNKPQNQLQEVLYFLIKRSYIDRRQMMLSVGVLNLPEYIRQLRHVHGLSILREDFVVKNKFDRSVCFGRYSVSDKKRATKLYRYIQDGKI